MELKNSSNDQQHHLSSKSPERKKNNLASPDHEEEYDVTPSMQARQDANITPLSPAADYGEDEVEEQDENIVMRMELNINIADTSKPTQEEIKEYESFSSKSITTTTNQLKLSDTNSLFRAFPKARDESRSTNDCN